MGVTWRPILVTMLHGRSYSDAESLLTSSLTAEALESPAEGEVLLMAARNTARSPLDREFPEVAELLMERGQAARLVPFDSDLRGESLHGLAVGADQLGDTIEGNTYLPGSIVDNLTSFGAVPWLPSVRFGGQAISYDPRKLQKTSLESLEERRQIS